MQIDCQQCEEQIGAYALYALSCNERILVEGHLRSCARCSLFAYHLQSVTQQLSLAVSPMAPSLLVKQRMLAEIQNEIASQMISAQTPLMTSVTSGVPASIMPIMPPTAAILTADLMEQRVLMLCETQHQRHARPSQEGQRCQCRRCSLYSTIITTESAVQEVQEGIQAGSEEQHRRQGTCYRGRQDLRTQQHNRRMQRALQVAVHDFSATKRQYLWLTLAIIAVCVVVLLSLLTGLKFIETILP